MLVKNREMVMAILYALSLTAWLIWVAIDNNDISVYGPLRYNLLYHEHGSLHHINLKMVIWIPSALLMIQHAVAAVAWAGGKGEFQPLGKTHGAQSARSMEEGVTARPGTSQLRALCTAATTVFSLIAMGVGNIWLFIGIAVICYQTQNIETNTENRTDYQWKNIVMDLYNVIAHHTGILFLFAFMLVVFIEVSTDKPCFWHPISWGIFFVWSFFSVIRMAYTAVTGAHLVVDYLPKSIISGLHLQDMFFHVSLMYMITGWLWGVSDSRCGATS